MFDVSPHEINQLNDVDLRELVGRLCEAELASRGLSTAAVTWGGSQTAADGGLDVRVSLPEGTLIDGYIPRFSTGFQVKTPDMPRAEIISEMRPKGAIRPVIRKLVEESGAYVIVSSNGSTADLALKNRQAALREALIGVDDANQLYTDFYDRTRLATWVRQHPGLIAWVKEKIGRSLVGWRPYGPWSGADVEADYLLDEKLRLHLGNHRNEPAHKVIDAIDQLRDSLAQKRKMVRLVGLSGVGKTRLVQALFDARIGLRPLSPSLAVYTNLSDNPDPQPIGLASDLIAKRMRAVLIVDNCPPDLHRRLSEICSSADSTLSVLTVEYDVREDQPEGTQVITLESSSSELIEELLRRRFLQLSAVNVRSIAVASGGNARIAIALAGTVKQSETVSDLSDEELFQRLFRQRHSHDDTLLQAAQVCSLVYSFQGDATLGNEAELHNLAMLVGLKPIELYRRVGELIRRDLVQRRGVWRAVLPHAIANRLAARALEDIPYELIDEYLVTGGTDRLRKSFSRRIAFLHEHSAAVAIVKRWLAPNGLLGDAMAFNELFHAMFENVAPVLPNDALAVLERVSGVNSETTAIILKKHQSLLRSLAYDPLLFERSALLLVLVATHIPNENEAKEASDMFVSLFSIYLSGTHATIEQRICVIEALLLSNEIKRRSLGLSALSRLLETTHFSSFHSFEFGARSRDYGYHPRSIDETTIWYASALEFIQRMIFDKKILISELRDLLGRKFRGLWTLVNMFESLESLALRLRGIGFWQAGWIACKKILHYDRDKLSPEHISRLIELEAVLKPVNFLERFRVIVLSDTWDAFEFENYDVRADFTTKLERLEIEATEFGEAIAGSKSILLEFMPDIFLMRGRTHAFGRGLARASTDSRAIWTMLVEGFQQQSLEKSHVQVFKGFLAELWDKDRGFAQDLLDSVLDDPLMITFIPELQSAVMLDSYGTERLKRAITSRKVPVQMFRNLALGGAISQVSGRDLSDLILCISEQLGGVDVAIEIMSMRLLLDRSNNKSHDSELLYAAREIMRCIDFKRRENRDDYNVAEIVRFCMAGSEGESFARDLVDRLGKSIAAYQTNAFDNEELLTALVTVQPHAVLDVLLREDAAQENRFRLFHQLNSHFKNPFDHISSEDLVFWCNSDSEKNFSAAASVIKFANKKGGTLVWSEQAKALLKHAPDPGDILQVFVRRFRPSVWSGSLAAMIEEYGCLLDNLEEITSSDLSRIVEISKSKIASEVAAERRRETENDRTKDERFE